MEKYNKWDQKRQRPQGQAAEDGERGAAQQGQGMDENGEEGEPLAPPEVQQPLEKVMNLSSVNSNLRIFRSQLYGSLAATSPPGGLPCCRFQVVVLGT